MTLVLNQAASKCLHLLVMPAQGMWVKSGYEQAFEALYHLWKSVKKEGLRSVGLTERAQALVSDEFYSLDEIHVLFHEKQAVGMFAYRWFDLHFTATCEQSYLVDTYPSDLIESLKQYDQPVMTVGQLMIHPDWRRSKIGTCVADLLAGFAVKRFLQSSASLAMSYSRNDRKTHELCYRYGAKPLLKDHVSYGIDSDIFAFFRGQVVSSPVPGLQAEVERLWAARQQASLYTPFLQKSTINV